MKIPIRIQMTPVENGATALFMILGHYRKYVPMDELREICIASRNGSSPEQLKSAAEGYGLLCDIKQESIEQLRKEKLPVIVRWKKRYYLIVTGFGKDKVKVVDPTKGEYKTPMDFFEKNYGGIVLTFEKGPDFVPGGKKESMYSLIKDRITPIIEPIIFMVILTLICIWLDTRISVGMKTFMDDIVTDDTWVRQFLDSLGYNDVKDIKPARDTVAILYMFLLYFLTLAQLFFSIRKNRIINETSRKMTALSNSKMIKKLLSLPLSFFEQYSAGELMNRLDNNEKLEQSIMKSLVPRMINTMMTIFYFFFLFSYDKTITLICLSIELINFIITIKLQEKSAIIARSNATSSNELNSSVLNGMNMIETIRSTGSEKDFFNAWYGNLMQVKDNQLSTQRINRLMSIVDSVHSFLIQAVRLFLGAYFIALGRITLGTMSLFMNIFNNMRSSLSSALSSMNAMQVMRTNIERVNDIMNRPSPEEIPLKEGVEYEKLSGDISVKNVSYRYNKGDDPALDNVSLDVKKGQMIALVGSTGCGKSTLLKIMAGLYTAQGGEVYYDGLKREEIPDTVFHSSIVTVDQEAVTFDDTVFANIQMWDETIEDFDVILAARDAQIHERIVSDKNGYNVKIQENGLNFSGGEIQRMELARALAHEPTVLFLDEFTSALDALTEDKVIRSIREKGTTSIIVAHRLSTIVDCDRIYVMDKGKIVEQGTHSELYKLDGLYKKLVSSQ
ncbi:MAG: ATP-binding cassette domain-containing protein [Erysipelotrichaceae bacterium]|nr:ATP-binding cassette domain-containing protein [Erysipelotrichaceae bacterium]